MNWNFGSIGTMVLVWSGFLFMRGPAVTTAQFIFRVGSLALGIALVAAHGIFSSKLSRNNKIALTCGLAISAVVVVALLGNSFSAKRLPPQTKALVPETIGTGMVSNGVYTHSQLGLTVPLIKEWNVTTEDPLTSKAEEWGDRKTIAGTSFKDIANNPSTRIILAMSKRPMIVNDSVVNPALVVQLIRVPDVSESKFLKDNEEFSIKNGLNLQTTGAYSQRTLGAVDFLTAVYKISNVPSAEMRLLVAIRNGHAIMIQTISDNSEDRVIIENVLVGTKLVK